uniref:Immunoglobulin domain-containing protein n=1 Tax=Cyprinus carpio TaxID=7962 RepID=A0A8C1RU46_CYPCA
MNFFSLCRVLAFSAVWEEPGFHIKCCLSSYNMRIWQLHLYLLIWCPSAETLTDHLTVLGQDVTITCDLNQTEVYWFLLKQLGSPVAILRSFSNNFPHYYNKVFELKYAINSKHHLFINNVTIDDLGVYCCMSTNIDPQFSNATRLYIIDPTPPTECQNYTEVQYIQQNQTTWQTLTLMFGLINAVLVFVVIGLLKVCACRNKRPADLSQQLHNIDLQPTQQHLDPNPLQHAEEDSSMLCTKIHVGSVNSTYVALQLPKS